MKLHVLTSLESYWLKGSKQVAALPILSMEKPKIQLPLQMVWIQLPHWAQKCGIEGKLLIPQEADSGHGDWQKIDWWLVSFLLLEGWHERLWEDEHGPIHSYSIRLIGWDQRAWDYAWVNRIALFLRMWVEHIANEDAIQLLGQLPRSKILMTHDVDAVKKTIVIRLKQGLFNLFNAIRHIARGQYSIAWKKIRSSCQFVFGLEDWWLLDDILGIEEVNQISARYHFYAKLKEKNIKEWIFDPSYDIGSKKLRSFLDRLKKHGNQIGLHPSFESWESPDLIYSQKKYLESIAGITCDSCRQHWLRFSWAGTWAAQSEAGIREDTTLMFNDRPGFRSSAALKWKPWNTKDCKPYEIDALPSIMMDSHFYDYGLIESKKLSSEISRWLNECMLVGGDAALLWHPHTLSKDYGWGLGFNELIILIKKNNLSSRSILDSK